MIWCELYNLLRETCALKRESCNQLCPFCDPVCVGVDNIFCYANSSRNHRAADTHRVDFRRLQNFSCRYVLILCTQPFLCPLLESFIRKVARYVQIVYYMSFIFCVRLVTFVCWTVTLDLAASSCNVQYHRPALFIIKPRDQTF